MIGFFVIGFFCLIGILCFFYIDDCYNGQFQVLFEKGEYGVLVIVDECNFVVVKFVIFLIVYYLIRLGYFFGFLKFILILVKIVMYFGFMVDFLREMFYLILEKKEKFIVFIYEIFGLFYVFVKML